MAYIKPVRPPMIIAADKVAKFEGQKPDPSTKEKRRQLADMFRKNNCKEK